MLARAVVEEVSQQTMKARELTTYLLARLKGVPRTHMSTKYFVAAKSGLTVAG